MADITEELATINNARFGRDIRHAIHDALLKLSTGGGGGSDSLLNIKITRADYNALETKSNTTVYYVVEESGLVNEYLGDVLINRGGGSSSEPMMATTTYFGSQSSTEPESGSGVISDVEYEDVPSPHDE